MRNITICCILLAAIAIACDKPEEKAQAAPSAPKATPKTLQQAVDSKMRVGDGKVEISDKSGTISISEKGNASLPKGFPKDVPICTGARVMISNREGDSFTVSLEVSKPPAEVAAEYHALMTAEDWKRTVNQSAAGIHMVGYDKGERQVRLHIFGERGKKDASQVSVIVSPKMR